MIKNIKSFKVGQIWNRGTGAHFETAFDLDWDKLFPDQDLSNDSNIVLTKPVTGKLDIYRLKEGLSVIASDVQSEYQATCNKCLKQFTAPLSIESTERMFLAEMPDRDFDPLEIFLIDLKDLTIDLGEMFRQEIILHFPLFPVCSEHCQGLCPGCKINLNDTKKHAPDCTGVKVEESSGPENRPFANLKDLLK
ncbi:MAG: YceD family protein [Candidatus Altimarinota bacterium]